ncbi:MAG TPA: hypothetical protein VHH36_09505 [Candidatus Thermoplasmatota archaeon]|nr:hypothetical protein [Candidatus Thermoplasmatota archaeon]
MRFALLAVVALLGAGCLSTQEPPPPAAPPSADEVEAAIGAPIEQLHDHTDASLHVGAHGLRLVNWSPLIPEEIGEEGFAGLRIVGDHAFVATDGAHAGFLIVDVSDPRAPRLVSQYSTPGGASQEAVPSWDGNWVFLNLQRAPGPADLVADPTRGTGTGIQIVDVRDKTSPKFVSFFPVEVQGTHVMMYFEWKGVPYLVFNGQPRREALPTGETYTPPPGNSVKIAEVVDVAGVRTLRVVSEFRFVEKVAATTSQGCFPHDQWVEEHPFAHRLLLYVAYWDCGAAIVDINDPTSPFLLHHDDEMAPSTRNRIHFFRPDPTLRHLDAPGARVVAWSGPEIDVSPGEPGYLRAYDVSDPGNFHQIGAWRLPGEVENDQPFLFSPHNFDFRGDLMAVAHYHAGVWVLNVSDPTHPRHVAYYLPHGNETQPFEGQVWRKTPNFPEAYFPNVYEVKWFTSPTDGETYLLVSERGSGLYVLAMDEAVRRAAGP